MKKYKYFIVREFSNTRFYRLSDKVEAWCKLTNRWVKSMIYLSPRSFHADEWFPRDRVKTKKEGLTVISSS